MTCPFCKGPICFPPRGEQAVCIPCDRRFVLVADYGWWGYTAEVYEPATEPE